MADEDPQPKDVAEALAHLVLASNAAAQASIRLASAMAALGEVSRKQAEQAGK